MSKLVKVYLSMISLLLAFGCDLSDKANSSNSVEFKKNSNRTGIYESDPNGNTYKVLANDTLTYNLKSKPTIPIERFQSLIISDECYAGELCVDWQLDEKGTRMYTSLMRRNLDKQIFYVIEGVIVGHPNVAGVVETGQGQFPFNKIYFDSLFVNN